MMERTQSVWYLPEMGFKENVGCLGCVVVEMRAQQHTTDEKEVNWEN